MSSHAAGPTLYPQPRIDPSLAPIENPLLVTRIPDEESDVFTNTYPLWKPPQGRTLFGGILIGEAIQAAQQTVSLGFFVHHMHCTFHAPPDTAKPLYIRVSRTADGKSSASRDVKVTQGDAIFFSAQCTFTRSGRATPVVHQTGPQLEKQSMAAPPDPKISQSEKRAFSEEMVRSHFLKFKGPNTSRADVDPFQWHDVTPVVNLDTSPSTHTLNSWTRSRGNMSDSRASHLAVLGCLTDSWALSSFPLMNPAATGEDGRQIAFMASLNHTVWFHDTSVRLDEWLLLKRSSSWAAEGRCLVEQQFWNKQGKLVATCVQEGGLRMKQPESVSSGASKI